MEERIVKKAVRERYGKIARDSSCGCSGTSCCSSEGSGPIAESIGYSREALGSVPDGANLGLGCGNPLAISDLKEGETVLDLGSGAGFDCLLAANQVGKGGKVIGVDMTHEMLERARDNAMRGGYDNVEFRLGEIEHLPVADGSVDVIISNCVINLSTDKQQVFDEAFRVLRPGGRFMVSDLVKEGPIPEKVLKSIEAYVGCISGAISLRDFLTGLKKAGFDEVDVREKAPYPFKLALSDPGTGTLFEGLDLTMDEVHDLETAVVSAKVFAKKVL